MRTTPTRTTRVLSAIASALGLIGLIVAGCAGQPAKAPGKAPASSAPPAAESLTAGGNPTSTPRAPVVIRGTGALVGPPQGTAASEPTSAGNGFQLNFVDTEIAAVVSAVLGDGLNVPYMVDPQVKGVMTLQASRPLSRDEVLTALESGLRTQGAALVEISGVYHVVPAKDAARRITSLQVGGRTAHGFGTYVVPLQFVGAPEMAKVLQPFAPEGGIINVDEARNLLILAGTSQEIETLLNVIRTFDVDWLSGMSFALYPLDYVDAKTLAGELQDVFAGGKSPLGGVVRFVPLTRLNALMVVTAQPKYLDDVATWIKRLDLGSTTPGRRIYVYEVQNGKAEELADSLGRILGLRTDAGRSATSPGGVGRSGIVSGAPSGSLPPGSIPSGMPGGAYSGAPPAYAAGGDSLSGRSAAAGNALEQGALQIVPDSDSNSLLILASPSEFAVIEAALKRLDVRPIQVLIEASIAEVTLTDELKYGLQWSYASKSGPLAFSESSTGSISQQFPGFSYLYTGSANIAAVLNALETLTNVKVLSSPKLMVLNNRDAMIEVGDQVPIAVQSAVSIEAPNAPIVNSLQLQQTGVILHVTPRANRSGKVTLDIAQEVSSVVPTTTSSLNSPTIQQRRLQSTVSVDDGDTIAIGGMIQESRSRSGDGIPFLRRIPLLGDLFGSTDRQHTRSELIVLLTPHVIRSEADANAAVADLEREFGVLRRAMPGLLKPPPARSDAPPSSQETNKSEATAEPSSAVNPR